MSAASCDEIIDVFEATFPGKLPLRMLMSAEKAKCLITDALHSDCKQNLMKDMGEAHFVLKYDET